MSSKRFQVTLPSNVNPHGLFPENLMSNYITKLPHRINLNANYEVGLLEMSYTYSWFNLPYQKSLTIWRFNKETYKFYIAKTVFIGPENFLTVIHLIEILNQLVNLGKYDTDVHKPLFFYSSVNKRISLACGIDENNYPIVVNMSRYMWEFLGYNYDKVKKDLIDKLKIIYTAQTHEELLNLRFTLLAPHPFDLRGTINSLYVYTDVIKPSIVGDVVTPLLRVVEIPPDITFGKQVVIKYTNPYYHKLSCSEFETIEVDIKDDTGRRIPFEFGRVIITLEFREIN